MGFFIIVYWARCTLINCRFIIVVITLTLSQFVYGIYDVMILCVFFRFLIGTTVCVSLGILSMKMILGAPRCLAWAPHCGFGAEDLASLQAPPNPGYRPA